jgi:hypothetical protein
MKTNVMNEFIDNNLRAAAETPDWRDVIREETAGSINIFQSVMLTAIVTAFLMLIAR